MNWIKVVLFIILVAVSVGLFFYTRRKEQKRKPSRPLVTGVVTPAKQSGLPKSLYMAEVTLDASKGNELVLEMLMQKHYKDAVLTGLILASRANAGAPGILYMYRVRIPGLSGLHWLAIVQPIKRTKQRSSWIPIVSNGIPIR